MKDFPLSSGGIGASAYDYKEDSRKPLFSRGVVWVTGLCLLCWTAAFFLYRQPAPLPRTMIRQKKLFGDVLAHEHYVDIKLCDNPHCHPACQQVEQARHSAMRLHESLAELQSKHTTAMRISCDREYYIGIEVCKNPGEVVEKSSDDDEDYYDGEDGEERTNGKVFHAPFYSLYHDAEGSGNKPNATELCTRQYPERPLHFKFDFPKNTTVHIAVCADGTKEPVLHQFQCV